MQLTPLYLGLDFGTSGARAVVIDDQGRTLAQVHCSYDIADWRSWLNALHGLCASLPPPLRRRIASIAIDGTSSSVLLCNNENVPIAPPVLYNDACAAQQVPKIAAHAPAGHTTTSATSSLAKLLHLLHQHPHATEGYFSDQASWLAAMMTGKPGLSDYHNALKLGYDVEELHWPAWIVKLGVKAWLPTVLAPGTLLGQLTPEVAATLDLPAACRVRAGTTDSIAAFIASGADTPGTGVTSLGSTLVLKLLSTQRIEDARYGVYSHRFGDLWLAGGASNSGGAVLRQFFDEATLARLSLQINPDQASSLDYYPLVTPGERFPINDPQRASRLTPRPASDTLFLHGLLEGIARIEARGYALLANLGATPLTKVLTVGGGAKNTTWTHMRQRLLGVTVQTANQDAAAYGAAWLAKSGSNLLCLHNDE